MKISTKYYSGGVAAVCGALMLAVVGCSDPQAAAIKALQAHALDFTVEDFHVAAGKGNLEAVQTFAEAGMGLDAASASGMTAMVKASEEGALSVVQWLLDSGAEVNGKGPNKRTPLVAAAKGGHVEVVRLLLKRGADPALRDGDDWSALTLAAYKGHTETVEILAPKSTDLLDDALLVAAFDGNPEVIDLLLNNGAYVNARSPNNQTALMIAGMNGHLDGVKLLLHNGANRYALDDEELTAANLAAVGGHAEVAEHLNQPPDPDEAPSLAGDLEGEELFGAAIEAITTGDVIVDEGEVAQAPQVPPAPSGPVRAQGVEVLHEEATSAEVPEKFRMRAYREENLPVVLKNVEAEEAEVRVLYGESERVRVKEGEPIGDTGLRVVKFERQYANSKHGKGELVDVSQMIVEDQKTGAKHLLVKDVPARSSETYAVMQLDDTGRAFDVRPQDEFTAKGRDFEEHFRVVDVRPTQVVIENTATTELFTIPRAQRRVQ